MDPILFSLRLPYHHTLGSDAHTQTMYTVQANTVALLYVFEIELLELAIEVGL